jgi:hypothetical protein
MPRLEDVVKGWLIGVVILLVVILLAGCQADVALVVDDYYGVRVTFTRTYEPAVGPSGMATDMGDNDGEQD